MFCQIVKSRCRGQIYSRRGRGRRQIDDHEDFILPQLVLCDEWTMEKGGEWWLGFYWEMCMTHHVPVAV